MFAKSGAEGVFCAALPETGLGLAVKADDGAGRAAQVMIAALIQRFGGFDEEGSARLMRFVSPRLSNWSGAEVGFSSRGPAGVKPASVAEGRMHVASTSRGLLADAATLLRLTALASLAFISAANLSLTKDRCADTAHAVQALHEDDHYQATTLLFAAARLGCEAEARTLLDRGAAIDAKDREGKTALAKAAEADKLPLIRLLLERGANVNARSVDCSSRCFAAERIGARWSRSCSSVATIRSSRPERCAPACRRSLERFDGDRR